VGRSGIKWLLNVCVIVVKKNIGTKGIFKLILMRNKLFDESISPLEQYCRLPDSKICLATSGPHPCFNSGPVLMTKTAATH